MASNFIDNLKGILDFKALWANHPDIVIAAVLLIVILLALEYRQLHEDRNKTNERCRAIRYRCLQKR